LRCLSSYKDLLQSSTAESPTYNGVAPSIGSLPVTGGQFPEAGLGHVLAQDLRHLALVPRLLQGVGQGSDPGERPGVGEALEENCAFVGVAGKF